MPGQTRTFTPFTHGLPPEMLLVSMANTTSRFRAAVSRVEYGKVGFSLVSSTQISDGATAMFEATSFQSVQVVPPSGDARRRTVKSPPAG